MRGTSCKRSSETIWHFHSHKLLPGLVVFFISLNFARNVGLIDTHNIIKVYFFLNSFSYEFNMQKLESELKFGS